MFFFNQLYDRSVAYLIERMDQMDQLLDTFKPIEEEMR